MVDLTTGYLGLKLRNPLVASASPICKDLANLRRLEDAGAAAIVLHSLFEEQINAEAEALDRMLYAGTESYAESISYFPDLRNYSMGPKTYLAHLEHAKQAVEIPVIASLN